ncbi:hypothetical protein [Chryseobacterium camelliae]|uniref:hypothetical protein n=1 Tax=Chryseobacterium camelliae TaxID=1265445 RepID=UPI000C1C942B|nr:hypothetical protein [Chryseobacterium camelliae]
MDNQFTNLFSKINFDQILGFIYFLIPTIIAVWTVYYIRKSRFYYVERTSIKLHDDIVKNIPDLTIKYKDSEINENLIFFRGTILFKSHTDIKKEDIDQEITIYSPDRNAIWKHFEITKASDDFQPTFTIRDNKVTIDRSMLKINDYIIFAGLLDSKNVNLFISHRIFNLVPKSIKLKESDLKYYKQSGIFMTLILVTLFSIKLYFNYKSKEWERKRIKDNKELAEVYKSVNVDLPPDIYDYETFFFKNNVKIKVKKLRDSFKNAKDQQIDIFNEKNLKVTDSLSKKYLRTKKDKDKIEVLNSIIDGFTKGLPIYRNPYAELERLGEKKLDTLIKTNKLKENILYTINDSIKLKFEKKVIPKKDSSSKNKKLSESPTKSLPKYRTFSDYVDIFMNFLGYLFIIILITITIYCWFMFVTLSRLLKIYQK